MNKTIVLSAGHDLSDPGAINDSGVKENSLTMKLVEAAKPLLEANGVSVIKVPDTLSLIDTISYINKLSPEPDLAIELHVNAGGGNGVEGWFYQSSEESKKLSDTILASLVKETGMKNRGSKDETTNKWGRLGFVHDTNPLAVLIECGFIDGVDDIKLLTTDEGRLKIARGLAKGILNYFSMSYKEPVVETISSLKEQINVLKKSITDLQDKHSKELATVKDECEAKVKKLKSKVKDFANSL